MRVRIFIILAMLAVTSATAWKGRQFYNEDRCLDSGGAWYGSLGCERSQARVDRIIVDKSARRLTAVQEGRVLRAFSISLGSSPTGQKKRQGDGRTPEGIYPIVAHKPDSAYHRALRVGYPTHRQIEAAKAHGEDPGGDIMIHGLPNHVGLFGDIWKRFDWTAGCVALTNEEIEWLYRATDDGTLVDIRA